MKNRFHVFCHKFTELAEVNMLVFLLLALLMVPSAWADNVDITYNGQTVTPPCSDDRTLTVASGVTSFVITHPNIPAGYAHSCSGMLYVNAPSGNSLSLSGEAKLRSGSSLYIYDGSGTSVSLYAKTGSGSYTVPTLYTSNTQATILFSHDGQIDNTNYVALNVTVLPSHFVSVSVPWKQESPWNYYVIWDRTGSWWYPEYRLDKVEFYVGQTVPTGKAPYLTLTLWGLNVKDANGNLLTTTQVNDSLLFTMPASDVTVVPTFSNCSDSYRGCGYNLVNESRTVNIGANSSINVYDDGGIDYPYANNFNGYLTVKAPAGHRVKVSGTVATEANGFDYLELYEGVKGASSSPICKVYSADSNVAVAVPANCKSVDSVLTLRFKTDHSAFANGLNLVVSAEPKIYNVTLNNNQLSKGTVSSDKVEAETRSTVTLTAYPESGYILKSVSVVNTATNATVATSGGWETDNKITFTMPAGNVEVTPNFVTNTYNINKIKIDGGDIELESTSAIVGSVVSLTAKSDDGYMLKDVVVKDASGNSVKINKNEFTSVKFTMPIGDVTVTPSWTKDLTVEGGLYLNMPKTGAPLFTIPKGVKSFKVYDDGGKSGNYSNNAEGKLLLTAPDGNVLVLTGNVNTYNSSDKLLVYNNLATEANLLGTLSGSSYCAYSSEARRLTLKFVSDGSGNASGLDLTVKVVKYELVQGDDGGNHYVNMFYRHNMTYEIPETLKSFKVYDDGGMDGNYSGNNKDTLVLKAPAGYVLQLSGNVTTAYSGDSLRIYSGTVDNADTVRLGTYRSFTSGEVESISKVLSMGNSMTLLFHSNGYDNYAGLDLTVKVVKVEAVLENDGESDNVNMFYQHKVTFEIPDTLKSFKVYDEGGKDENYNDNNSDTLVLKAPAGYLLQLSGSVATDAYGNDSLRVYNGAGVNADSLLGTYKRSSNINKVLSMGNSMTLLFHSNGYDSYAGLDLTVKVVKVEAVLENDGESDYVNMFYQHKVTFEIPDTLKSFKVYDEGGKDGNYSDNNRDTLVLKAPAGYLLQLSGSVATDAYGNDSLRVYNGAGINADSLLGTYKRSSNISKVLSLNNSMTLVFNSNGYTNDAGLDLTVKVVKVEVVLENDGESDYVNMFYQRKVTFEIPDTLKSFKVYDEGGKDGNYSGNNRDSLVLKAPAGYVLQLSGSVTTEGSRYDSLRVYNGAGVNADSLLRTYKSSISGKVLSRGESMTLLFHSDGYTNDAGLDLTVKVIPIVNQITYTNKNSGGSVTTDSPRTGKIDSIVNYSYSYSSGYIVKEIKAVSADGDSVTVNGGWYNDKKAFFKMPPAAVTLTSTYTNNLSAEGGLYINMLRYRKVTATIPEGVKSFKVYDNGGKDGDYSNYSSDTLVLMAPAGYVLQLSGSVTTQYVSDYLGVYNGAEVNTDKLLETYWGLITISNVLSMGNSMTFVFNSDGSNNFAGLDLTVTLVPKEYTLAVTNVAGGSLADVPETASTGDTVTLTAVPTNSNYMLVKFVVKDAANNEVPVIRNTLTEGKFKMPASNVTITPVFVDTRSTDITATDGFHLDMPRNTTVEINLPVAVKSFKLYDHSGKTGDYIRKSDDHFVFNAPAGYHFKVTGSMNLDGIWDNLYVYDGMSTILFNHHGAENGATYDVETIETSLNRMMVFFHADDNNLNYAGLDLLVSIVPNSYTVAIEQISGGTLSSDKASAIEGDVVTLTATPDEGYMLNGFVIKDASGNDVPFRGGDFIDKQGSFTMPAGNVTVTPVFTNKPIDLFVTIPATGTKTVVLPDGMNTFWVYDDGDGGLTSLLSHSYNANGSLVLIAPENSRIYARIRSGFNSPAALEVFDGASTEATSFGATQNGSRYTSTSNAMTFNITTSETATGWAGIAVELLATRNINVVSADGGTATSDKTTADRNETVTVTATPDDGLLFKGIKITNKFGDVLGMKGYETWANNIWTTNDIANLTQAVSFRMPNSDINIEPKFGEELEASDSVFLEMPETGSKTVTIPSRVASFNVYDDGGRGGTFSSKSDGNLVLNAPEGYRFQVSGTVSGRKKDIAHLCVYEGGAVSDDKALVCGTGSVFAAAATDQDYDSYVGEIGTTVSEGNTITLRFWTTSSWETGDGIELVVKVLKPRYGAVTIVRNDDGTSKAVLDGDYNGSEAINIATPIAVDEIDFQRAFSARTPSTALLPFTLPEGSTTNAEFYQLTEVKQVKRSWKARFDYIGDGTLPQANTPYALILPAGQTKLEFNLNNKQAVLQTNNINTVKVSNDDWLFVGVYSYKVWEPGDEELGLAYAFSGKDNSNEGKFGKIKIADDATELSDYPYANPLRAYLRKKDASVVLKARGSSVAMPVASFGLDNLPETIDAEFVKETADGEKTTFVGRMNTRTGEFRMLRDYDLKGRNVGNKANRARGAYYGKKVIKK